MSLRGGQRPYVSSHVFTGEIEYCPRNSTGRIQLEACACLTWMLPYALSPSLISVRFCSQYCTVAGSISTSLSSVSPSGESLNRKVVLGTHWTHTNRHMHTHLCVSVCLKALLRSFYTSPHRIIELLA